ncbi:MAG: hypothetical protein ACRC62_29060 [Microcoleus sp.]
MEITINEGRRKREEGRRKKFRPLPAFLLSPSIPRGGHGGTALTLHFLSPSLRSLRPLR